MEKDDGFGFGICGMAEVINVAVGAQAAFVTSVRSYAVFNGPAADAGAINLEMESTVKFAGTSTLV